MKSLLSLFTVLILVFSELSRSSLSRQLRYSIFLTWLSTHHNHESQVSSYSPSNAHAGRGRVKSSSSPVCSCCSYRSYRQTKKTRTFSSTHWRRSLWQLTCRKTSPLTVRSHCPDWPSALLFLRYVVVVLVLIAAPLRRMFAVVAVFEQGLLVESCSIPLERLDFGNLVIYPL